MGIVMSFCCHAEQKLVKIGVLAFDGPAYTLQRWQPTIDYLNSALPDYHFVIIPTDIPTMEHLVRNQLVDFTLTNGIQFLLYKYRYQAVKMLNLSPFDGEASNAIGSALIGRIDEAEITNLNSLRNRLIVSVSEDAFGGFRVMEREFLLEGVRKSDLKNLAFIGYPQQDLLAKVLSGEADFAIVPTCLLEGEVRDGVIPPNSLKVMRRQSPSFSFPCEVSSQLYPNWTLARMKHVSVDYANHIARILLSIPPESQITVKGKYGGWSVPVDDSGVYRLMDDIGIRLQPSYFVRMWEKYRGWVLILGGLVLLFIGYHFRVNFLVHIRSSQLRDEIESHKETAKLLEKETNQLYKAQRVLLSGELASGIAHELNQPLMSIGIYAAAGKKCVAKGNQNPQQLFDIFDKIEQQTLSAGDVIQRMRDFTKRHSNQKELISIVTLLNNTLLIFRHTFSRKNIEVSLDIEETSVYVDPILIQQVVVNLIQNSIDALNNCHCGERAISIMANCDEHYLTLELADNGSGISDEQLKQLFMPFQSSKRSGLGLGMVISKRIIEMHSGTIEASQQQQGTRFLITLPRCFDKE